MSVEEQIECMLAKPAAPLNLTQLLELLSLLRCAQLELKARQKMIVQMGERIDELIGEQHPFLALKVIS